MISINDTTILAVLSRYPDMSHQEINEYINKIEIEENRCIAKALVGQMDQEELSSEQKLTLSEIRNWSVDRTNRERNEQWTARRRRKETRTALRLNELYQQGVIPEQVLLMYGVSGDLPDRNVYSNLSANDKEAIWNERMTNRYGPNWRESFISNNITIPNFMRPTQPIITREIENFGKKIDWTKEGF